MPIRIEHDGSTPELDALVALFLAQGQEEQQQQQPAPTADLMEQPAPLAAGGMNGSAPRSSAPVNGSAGPSYQPRSRSQSPRYASYGGGRGGRASGIDRLIGQNALEQFKAGEDRFALEARAQQQAEMEAMRSDDIVSRQQAQDVPQWIQEGLSQGALKYSPSQLRERQQLSDSIDRVHSDPGWNPQQRAQFESRQRERIRQIDLAPQQVPFSERPVPPAQQYESQIIKRPVQIDENTTIELPVIPYTRNGETRFELTPEGELQKELAIEKIKHQRALEIEAIKQEQKAANPKETPQQKEAQRLRLESFKLRQSAADKKLETARSWVEDAENKVQQATEARDAAVDDTERATKERELKSAIRALDMASKRKFDAEVDMQRMLDEIGIAAAQDAQASGSSPADLEAAAMEDMGMLPPNTAPTPQPPAQPVSQQPVPVASAAELAALPPGTKFILPDGRTGTRQ